MIRTIVSLRQEDGTFPEVGMWNRTVINGPSVRAVRRKALSWARDRSVRLEHHNGTLLFPPFLVEYF